MINSRGARSRARNLALLPMALSTAPTAAKAFLTNGDVTAKTMTRTNSRSNAHRNVHAKASSTGTPTRRRAQQPPPMDLHKTMHYKWHGCKLSAGPQPQDDRPQTTNHRVPGDQLQDSDVEQTPEQISDELTPTAIEGKRDRPGEKAQDEYSQDLKHA